MFHAFHYNAGDRLDNFKIVKPIFAGPLAEIYHALDTLTQQEVALKVPSMDIINNPLVYYHYQNEGQVLAGINHPRIVRYIQRDKSSAYNIFEYIPGLDMRKRMHQKGPFSFSKARHYVTQVAQGLSHIHNCGIIHLDIKPENILITLMDTIKVVDFGLACRLSSPDMLQSDFDTPQGTPYYAAPEQLLFQRDEPRTDLYSLTLVYYEMLTGQLPFEKSQDPARVRGFLRADPVPPRQYRPDIPKAIERFILKGISKDPEMRHLSAEAYIKALNDVHLSTPFGSQRPETGSDTLVHACPVRLSSARPTVGSAGVLVALDDNDRTDAIVQTAIQESIVRQTGVTLLTVVSGDKNDDWNRYGDEVRGKKWGRKLEDHAQQFRQYGIDPLVRVRDGDPGDVIVQTALDSSADLIIIGRPKRRLLKRIFGGSTLDRVLKKAPCRVHVVQDAVVKDFPFALKPDTLSIDELRLVDYHLVSIWIQQINWLTEMVEGMLVGTASEDQHSEDKSPMAVWIDRIKSHPQWSMMQQWVEEPMDRINRVMAAMITSLEKNDHAELHGLYLKRALPALCDMRESIVAISNTLRDLNPIVELHRADLLEQSECPISRQPHSDGGPFRKIQALKEYFCEHSDKTPEQCLQMSDAGQSPSTSGETDP